MVKVLIVDDDEDDRQMIRDAFRSCSEKVKVNEVSDGNEVFNYLQTHTKPSFILLDINMPGKSGFQVMTQLKSHKKYSSIPVYVFTTSRSLSDKMTALRLGASKCIVKPSSYEMWVNTICSLVTKTPTSALGEEGSS